MKTGLVVLDMGGSAWRAGIIGPDGPAALAHRYQDLRWPPFIQKHMLEEGEFAGRGQFVVDNYKRFLGLNPRRSLIGEDSIGVWLARRLAGLHDDASQALQTRRLGLVLPLPACLRDRERREVLEAARLASFLHVEMPDETGLALNSHLHGDEYAFPLLYWQMGAGTTVMSVVNKPPGAEHPRQVAAESSLLLGGDDMDGLVMRQLLVTVAMQLEMRHFWDLRRFADDHLLLSCERMKKELAAGREMATLRVDHISSRSRTMPPGFELQVSPEVFGQTVVPVLQKLEEMLGKLLGKLAEAGLDRREIKQVVIAGGMGRHTRGLIKRILQASGMEIEQRTLPADCFLRAGLDYLEGRREEMEGILAGLEEPPPRQLEPYRPGEEAESPNQELVRQAVEEARREAPPPRPSDRAATASAADERQAREASPPPSSASRWAQRYGGQLAEAEAAHRTDPDRAVSQLVATAHDLLELAQTLAGRTADPKLWKGPLVFMGEGLKVFGGAAANRHDALESQKAQDLAALAAGDPVLGGLLITARAAVAAEAYDDAAEALKLVNTRLARLKKIAKLAGGRGVEKFNLALEVVNGLRLDILRGEAEGLVKLFTAKCEQAKIATTASQQRERCAQAMGHLSMAAAQYQKVKKLYESFGFSFEHSAHARRLEEIAGWLDHCVQEQQRWRSQGRTPL